MILEGKVSKIRLKLILARHEILLISNIDNMIAAILISLFAGQETEV